MITTLVSYYNEILKNTGFFEVNFDLAEKVCDDKKEFYAVYNSDGGYDFTNQDFSSYRGLSYWFLKQQVRDDIIPDPNVAGKWRHLIQIPLSLICIIPRNIIGSDCSTTGLEVQQTLSKQFSGQTKELRKLIGATQINYGPQQWITDRKTILASQYKEVAPVDVDYQYHYFQMDVPVTVIIPTECLEEICEIESQDIINLFNWCDPRTYNRLTDENRQCIIDELCSGSAGSVNVNQSDGDLIQNVAGQSPAANYNVADSLIQSSGGAFTDSVQATDTYKIADVGYIDINRNPQTEEYNTGNIIDCTATLVRIYRPPLSSGQWPSFRNEDDGFQVQSGTYDYNPGAGTLVDLDKSNASFFTTMLNNNAFGNTSRFTNDLGGTVTDGSDGSTADYIIDHYTGLGWYIVAQPVTTWNIFILSVAPIVVGPYNDFFPPPSHYMESISNNSLASVFNYAPFNINQSMWSSSTYGINPNNAVWFNTIGPQTNFPKAGNASWIACRNHYI